MKAIIGVAAFGALAHGTASAQPLQDIQCETPPVAFCSDECSPEDFAIPGNFVEPISGREFFLDYPCDLRTDEDVIVILNLHGAGSTGNRQRHYFPIVESTGQYRLVVATPTAGMESRIWSASQDDAFLEDLSDWIFARIGKENVQSFWLAGHSQGGITATRLVCSDYFGDKVDGLLSLSGGRIGRIEYAPNFFPANRRGREAPAATSRSTEVALDDEAAAFDCEFSYIYASGEHEIVALPDNSPLARKYGCRARVRDGDIVDDAPGYVSGGNRDGVPNPAYGIEARPGTARVFVYPGCADGRLVADVWRLDKGHTEGLEPRVTQSIAAMIAAAPGGKLRGSP